MGSYIWKINYYLLNVSLFQIAQEYVKSLDYHKMLNYRTKNDKKFISLVSAVKEIIWHSAKCLFLSMWYTRQLYTLYNSL